MKDMGFSGQLRWDIDIMILQNRYIMADVGRVLLFGSGLVLALLAVLFLVEHNPENSASFSGGGFFAVMMGITLVLTAVFIWMLWGNRYKASYVVDKKGVRFITRTAQRKRNALVNSLLIILGLASRNPGTAGIGVLGNVRQDMSLKWKNVRKVIYHRRDRVFILKGGLMGKVIVFCGEENVHEVHNAISSFVAKQIVIR